MVFMGNRWDNIGIQTKIRRLLHKNAKNVSLLNKVVLEGRSRHYLKIFTAKSFNSA